MDSILTLHKTFKDEAKKLQEKADRIVLLVYLMCAFSLGSFISTLYLIFR